MGAKEKLRKKVEITVKFMVMIDADQNPDEITTNIIHGPTKMFGNDYSGGSGVLAITADIVGHETTEVETIEE